MLEKSQNIKNNLEWSNTYLKAKLKPKLGLKMARNAMPFYFDLPSCSCSSSSSFFLWLTSSHALPRSAETKSEKWLKNLPLIITNSSSYSCYKISHKCCF